MNCYFINAAHPEYLLTIGDKSTKTREGQLIIWKYEKGLQNQFMIFKERMVNALSGHLLEPFSKEKGSIVVQDSVYKRQEKWHYYPDMTIRNSAGYVLDVQGGRFEEGTPIILWNNNGSQQQKWIFCTVLKTGRKVHHHHHHHHRSHRTSSTTVKRTTTTVTIVETKEVPAEETQDKSFFQKVAEKVSEGLSTSSESDDDKEHVEETPSPAGKKHRKKKHHTGEQHKHRKHHSKESQD
ncbi:QXW lectin repeat family protein [Trichomonas vaginalis G3]|uniref:QXW lectin repeat family protein n=1 Tax=Trichomonas vaginalis (strain ATCC PRA-98 / G3) TaxID=412133 RepID=A2FJD9_TRIV3|nr:beta/gamma crystallin family [Trichomonas vaginalis G3]EAX95000.1 QXW lectin repeat family protein [Trichomonas vaginalis G3]KAI5497018.1 beta/gamma crystallin family [Trichomonas vaginalis G3]|eukprot:XP_001307930.1 QXW lectin repeat family protein [Trichomonas vaginalis G3]